METFKIQTIEDRNLSDGGSVWTAILNLIPTLLTAIASIFGSSPETALTNQNWIQIFPFNGQWYNSLRAYMSTHIKYASDIPNIPKFTLYFCHNNNITPDALFLALAKERQANGITNFQFPSNFTPRQYSDTTPQEQKYIDNYSQYMSSPYPGVGAATGVTVTPTFLTDPKGLTLNQSSFGNLFSNPIVLIILAGVLFGMFGGKERN